MTALGEQVTRDGDQVTDGTAVTLLTAAQMKVGPGSGEASGLQPAAEERPGSGTRPPAERAGLEDTSAASSLVLGHANPSSRVRSSDASG